MIIEFQSGGHASQVPASVRALWHESGLHRTETLAQALERAALLNPGALLTLSQDSESQPITLKQLHERGLSLARKLHASGVRAADVLAVQLPSSVEGVLLQRAAAALGAVFLPIVPIYGVNELRHILRDSKAHTLVIAARNHDVATELLNDPQLQNTLRNLVVVGDASMADTSEELPERYTRWSSLLEAPEKAFEPHVGNGDELALLVYTSGTTAAPKGVMHSANSLLAEGRAMAIRRSREPMAQLSPWPTGHIAGLVVLLDYMLHGRTTVLMQRWDAARAVELIERHAIVASSGTGFHLAALLDAADATGKSLATLKDYLAGAAAVPASLVQRCVDRGIATYRAYGLSEHPTVTIGCVDDPLSSRLQTEGSLAPGNEVRVVNEHGQDQPVGVDGELVTRGPERFLGYRDPVLNSDAFLEGGWFLTGDIGYMDNGGYLHLTDRKKDIVNRGGEKISSREVEDALLALPEVTEAAVVGFPDERLGERICAVLVWRAGCQLSIDAIAAHFQALGKARQKTPERIVSVESLPRNAAGKVDKATLRKMMKASLAV